MKNISWDAYLRRRRVNVQKLVERYETFEDFCKNMLCKGVNPPKLDEVSHLFKVKGKVVDAVKHAAAAAIEKEARANDVTKEAASLATTAKPKTSKKSSTASKKGKSSTKKAKKKS